MSACGWGEHADLQQGMNGGLLGASPTPFPALLLIHLCLQAYTGASGYAFTLGHNGDGSPTRRCCSLLDASFAADVCAWTLPADSEK